MTDPRTRRRLARGVPNLHGVEYLAAFSTLWCRLLWDAMAKSGEGFPKPKVRRKERRGDKRGAINRKALRGVAVRGLVAGHKPSRPWVTRASRARGDLMRWEKRQTFATPWRAL